MKEISYAPILKWKQGEYTALKELYSQDKAALTPLVEIIPIPTVWDEDKAPIELDAHVAKLPGQVATHWGKEDPIWVDSWLLQDERLLPDGTHVFRWILDQLRHEGVKAIPVVWLDSDQATLDAAKSAVETGGRGACIRFDETAGDDPKLQAMLEVLLSNLGLEPEDVDIVLDAGAVRPSEVDRTAISCRHILARLPYLRQWRTLIFASSGFPENMSGQDVGISTIQRADWLTWQRLFAEHHEGRIERLPLFSDYAIAHPEIADLDPRTMQMSANIRYTSVDTWVIFKGRGVRRYGFDQIFDLSADLIADGRYRGQGFSFGDAAYYRRGTHRDSKGNASQWRRDATSHHLTFVVRQIAAGSEPVRVE